MNHDSEISAISDLDPPLLIAEIRAAFDGVSRVNGTSISEAKARDTSSHEEALQARLLDSDITWDEIDIPQADPYGLALSYFDPIGFRYHVPAYLIHQINCELGDQDNPQYPDVDVTTSLSTVLNPALLGGDAATQAYYFAKYQLLSEQQCQCIARFLALNALGIKERHENWALNALIGGRWISKLPQKNRICLSTLWPNEIG